MDIRSTRREFGAQQVRCGTERMARQGFIRTRDWNLAVYACGAGACRARGGGGSNGEARNGAAAAAGLLGAAREIGFRRAGGGVECVGAGAFDDVAQRARDVA